MPVPPGSLVFAWRLRNDSADGTEVVVESFRELSGSVTAQNPLEWVVPEGRWLIGMFHTVPGGMCDKGNGPEADPGSREAVLFHLDHIFGRLQPRLEQVLRVDAGRGHFGQLGIRAARQRALLVAIPLHGVSATRRIRSASASACAAGLRPGPRADACRPGARRA